MFQKLRSWLIRHRDQTAVSYSRFNRLGEEDDDKPPPSTIIVAPFNENAAEYMLFGVCHVQKSAVYFASFGMAMVILTFLTSFFEFDWYHHKRGVDIGALLFLFFYLIVGVLIHYHVIYGIKKQLARYLLPFIAVYTVLCTFEVFMCLALLFKIVEPAHYIHVQLENDKAPTQVQIKNPPFALLLLGIIVILCVQGVMLTAVLRCRHFLSQKQEHEIAMKVAEKSKQEFPTIQIMLASQNTATLSSNGNGITSFAPPNMATTSDNAVVNPLGNQQPAAPIQPVTQNIV